MVQPGDVLVGDGEGVVVIPAGAAEDVAARCGTNGTGGKRGCSAGSRMAPASAAPTRPTKKR